jgi:hypothetical protein
MKLIMENWKRFLKEDFDEEALPDENDEVVDYIINATRVGQSPDEITQGLIEAGLTEEQALAALADAFEQELPDEEVEVDLDEAALGRTTASDMRDTGGIKDRTKAATAAGVSDNERNVLLNLQKKLAAAAQVSNIAQGQILQLATKLDALLTAEIEKHQKK